MSGMGNIGTLPDAGFFPFQLPGCGQFLAFTSTSPDRRIISLALPSLTAILRSDVQGRNFLMPSSKEGESPSNRANSSRRENRHSFVAMAYCFGVRRILNLARTSFRKPAQGPRGSSGFRDRGRRAKQEGREMVEMKECDSLGGYGPGMFP